MVANQNLNWVYFILEGLGMENVAIFFGQLEYFTAVRHILKPFGTFCGHLVHFVVIWYILWSFGTFCGHLVQFPHIGTLYQETSGNPGSARAE
jgi:hypothetical protein